MLTKPQAMALGAAVLAVLAIDYIQAQDEQAQTAGLLGLLLQPFQAMQMMTDNTSEAMAQRNIGAFLAMIRTKEAGTTGIDGYRVMFGGRKFSSFADHPRRAAQFKDKKGNVMWTSAAGAYQFMAVSPLPGGGSTKVNTWDRLAKKLSLSDFGPANQDAAAVELVREAGALADVMAGRFDTAVSKVRGIWASMPGAGYDQPEAQLAEVRDIYQANGGAFA